MIREVMEERDMEMSNELYERQTANVLLDTARKMTYTMALVRLMAQEMGITDECFDELDKMASKIEADHHLIVKTEAENE